MHDLNCADLGAQDHHVFIPLLSLLSLVPFLYSKFYPQFQAKFKVQVQISEALL